jgi:hypothetical protein
MPAAPGPGLPAPLDPNAEAIIPWDPDALRPIFEELIDGAEESRVEKFRAAAVEASLPDSVVKEIAKDAAYAPAWKRTITSTAPRVTAKTMSRIGISGKYSEEAILATALVSNFVQGRRLAARLEKLIEEAKAAKAAAENKQEKKA